jgi:hypothetical protein
MHKYCGLGLEIAIDLLRPNSKFSFQMTDGELVWLEWEHKLPPPTRKEIDYVFNKMIEIEEYGKTMVNNQ